MGETTVKSARRFGHRYPWASWFRQRRFTLLRGRDYSIMTHGMAIMARRAATRHGIKANIAVVNDGRIDVLVVSV